MAQKTMYPAKSGSPYTTITAAIGISDTEISVADLSVLPAAPNICVIYVSSTKWERCIYSAKSNSTGAGTITVSRSADGHASSDGSNGPLEFDSGAKVMRNYTAYDHDLFRENILDLATNKQPIDATLTAFAGVSTAANKLPYSTGVDTFSSCDFTSFGRSLVGTTTASAVRDLISSASSTTATMNIYVDKAATGEGTGVDWTNAFTTVQAAVDSLPAIINHAVTIWVRKGATPYAENITIQRVVAAGSITIRGEYYFYGTNASSKTGKIDIGSGDYGYAYRAQIAPGDVIWMEKWSGSVGGSYQTQTLYDTVASVSDTEISLSNNTGIAFDTTWSYHVVKTEISAVTAYSTKSLAVSGLISASAAFYYCNELQVSQFYVENDTAAGANIVRFISCKCDAIGGQQIYGMCVVQTNTGYSFFPIAYTESVGKIQCLTCFCAGQNISTGRGMMWIVKSYANLYYCGFWGLAGATLAGIVTTACGYVYNSYVAIDGYDASNKLAYGQIAVYGGKIQNAAMSFGSNITTQKNPANWAASTDGSYIS